MLFGIITMIIVGCSWTLWGAVAGAASKRNLNMGLMTAVCAMLGGLLSIPAAIIIDVIPYFSEPSILTVFALVVLGGIFNLGQLQFMSDAMKHGPNGIIWSFIQAGFLCPFAMGILLFGKTMTWSFAAAIVMVLAALVIFACSAENTSKGKWLLFTILAFISTCLCQSMNNAPSYLAGAAEVSGIWRTVAFYLGLCAGFAIMIIFNKPVRLELPRLFKNKYTWLFGILLAVEESVIYWFCFYSGMDALAETGYGPIAIQLQTAASIVCFELYAVLLLREKRSTAQIIATLLCLGSIVAICF